MYLFTFIGMWGSSMWDTGVERDLEREKDFNEIFNGMMYIFIDSIGEIDGIVFSQIESCFLRKYDVAVIALAQIMLESKLVELLHKKSIETKKTFKDNINLAFEVKLIDRDMFQALDEIRRIRNEILHPNDKDDRFLDLLARESVYVVASFLEHKSRITD